MMIVTTTTTTRNAQALFILFFAMGCGSGGRSVGGSAPNDAAIDAGVVDSASVVDAAMVDAAQPVWTGWDLAAPPDLTDNLDAACAHAVIEADVIRQPVDIIVVVDNSGSMEEEIAAANQNINVNFANILAAEGLDYHVVLLSAFGTASTTMCITPPLGANQCNGLEPGPLATPTFLHYTYNIDSYSSLNAITYTYRTPDSAGLAPLGWMPWIRRNSKKVFIEITDDDNLNMTADAFETALFALSPNYRVFGDASARNYVFHSILGITNNPAGANVPYAASAPVQGLTCNTAYSAGTQFQLLSQRSGGLRFPLCNHNNFDAIFQQIADDVVVHAAVPCQFAIPQSQSGQPISTTSAMLEYAPTSGAAQTFTQVAGASACVADGFYVDVAAGAIVLCPNACDAVAGDAGGKISVVLDCAVL